MDVWEVDARQARIYERAGRDPSEPASPIAIAKAILGRDAVRVVSHSAMRSEAELVRVYDRYVIYVRAGLPRMRTHFNVAHETAEHDALDYIGEDKEALCNAVAAAILSPRRAFMKRLRAVGENFEQLALPFNMTQTAAALRLGETTDRPLVVVSPALVRVRGADFCWRDPEALRRFNSGPGITKVPLTDERRRFVLLGDELADTA